MSTRCARIGAQLSNTIIDYRINYAVNPLEICFLPLCFAGASRSLIERSASRLINTLVGATIVLLVYLEPFQEQQRLLLDSWQQGVHYWPRSQTTNFQYDYSLVLDWWLLFSRQEFATLWIMRYPENSRVVRTLFD